MSTGVTRVLGRIANPMGVRQRMSGALGAVLAVTTWAPIGRADDAAAAQALFDQGKKAVAARKYDEACPKFEESLRLQPALGTLLNLADCYEREGKLATAWSRFLELATKAAAAGQTERARIGKKRAAALAPRLSNLVIAVTDTTAGLEVKRDGTVAGNAEWGTPIPVDTGPHTVEATAAGKQPWSTSVNIDEDAKTSTVTVPELAPVSVAAKTPGPAPMPQGTTIHPSGAPLATAPASDPAGSNRGLGVQKVLALVSAGIGLAGVGVGSYFGLQAMSKHNDAHRLCPTQTCDPIAGGADGPRLWSEAVTAGDRSTVAFVVASAGLAGAAVLWFTAPKSEQAVGSSARLGVGIGSLQFGGAW